MHKLFVHIPLIKKEYKMKNHLLKHYLPEDQIFPRFVLDTDENKYISLIIKNEQNFSFRRTLNKMKYNFTSIFCEAGRQLDFTSHCTRMLSSYYQTTLQNKSPLTDSSCCQL